MKPVYSFSSGRGKAMEEALHTLVSVSGRVLMIILLLWVFMESENLQDLTHWKFH